MIHVDIKHELCDLLELDQKEPMCGKVSCLPAMADVEPEADGLEGKHLLFTAIVCFCRFMTDWTGFWSWVIRKSASIQMIARYIGKGGNYYSISL